MGRRALPRHDVEASARRRDRSRGHLPWVSRHAGRFGRLPLGPAVGRHVASSCPDRRLSLSSPTSTIGAPHGHPTIARDSMRHRAPAQHSGGHGMYRMHEPTRASPHGPSTASTHWRLPSIPHRHELRYGCHLALSSGGVAPRRQTGIGLQEPTPPQHDPLTHAPLHSASDVHVFRTQPCAPAHT